MAITTESATTPIEALVKVTEPLTLVRAAYGLDNGQEKVLIGEFEGIEYADSGEQYVVVIDLIDFVGTRYRVLVGSLDEFTRLEAKP